MLKYIPVQDLGTSDTYTKKLKSDEKNSKFVKWSEVHVYRKLKNI